MFRCHPLRKYWDVKIDCNCVDATNIFLADGVISVLSDFTILLLPMPLLWKLHLSKKRKVKFVLVFGGGIL